ncbi:golgin subfamily A member 6-like protein 24 [Macrobrachium nipponense]|uniref:golgin subfamily A member 6-like protein 24 n=1 Tax=Macrobrachium nipponense TaxID=159736 RepID=UPI0030C883B7
MNGRFLGDLPHVGIVESWTPEVVETRPPNGIGIETSVPASAIPWMALMAVVVPALLAVVVAFWRRKLIGTDALDGEEDDLEVSTLEPVLLTEDLESSEEEEEEEEEQLNNPEEEDYEDEQLDSFENDLDNSEDDDDDEEEEEEEEEEKDILETEELEPTEEEAKEEEEEEAKEKCEPKDTTEEDQLLRQHPDQLEDERKRLAEDLEASEVHAGKLESLLNEANDEIARLRKQILDKEILIGKKAAAETELKREVDKLNDEKEQLQSENQNLEEYAELATGRADIMDSLHQELLDTVTSLETQLEKTDHLLKKRDDEESELRSFFQQIMDDKEMELESALHKANELEERNCQLERNLANEKQRNVSLQNEALMLKGRAQSLESALLHKESRLDSATEALNNERAKNDITCAELQVMRNWVTELGGENAVTKEDLKDKCLDITLLRKELGDEQEKTQILKEEVQLLKKWVSELGGQNTNLREDLEEALLEVTTLKNSLSNEKRDALHCRKEMEILLEEEKTRKEKLEVTLHHAKDLERERSEMRLLFQERLKEKDNERKKLQERTEQLQQNLESAKHEQHNLESSLKHAERELSSLKRAESKNLHELELLGKKCESLREKCRIQEESIIKERQRVRDHLRTQQEELRNQDKYMLMALLQGTAQRNFHLEHIELERRNNSEDMDPQNCAETRDGSKDHVKDEDLHDQVRRVEEEQYVKYSNAQREKKDYGKQWEALTQMVEDLIQGDEQKNG